MNTKASLRWLRSGNLRPTYIIYGEAAALAKEMAFLSGMRGAVEKLVIATLLKLKVSSPVTEPLLLLVWDQIVQAVHPRGAFLLHTGRYKETTLVGVVARSSGEQVFIKFFDDLGEAEGEIRRAKAAARLVRPWFRPAEVLIHNRNLVCYELLSHGNYAPDPRAVEQAVLAMCMTAWGMSATLRPLQSFFSSDVCKRLLAAGITDEYFANFLAARGDQLIPEVACHGDVTPWNTFLDREDQLCLIDYERVGTGPPLTDVFHYHIQPSALRSDVAAALRALHRIARATSRDFEDLRVFLLLYLIQQLDRDTFEWVERGRRHHQLSTLIRTKAEMLILVAGERGL